MAALILLLAMLAFLVWAIAHTHRRINWYRDDFDAEAFLTALNHFAIAADASFDAARRFAATIDANGLEWVDIHPGGVVRGQPGYFS